MKNTFFDASAFAAGLDPTYDATQTHFTYLEDGEVVGGGAWMAQPGENLHITIQNTNHTVVAHYFYNKVANSWRYHGYGAMVVIPYGNHVHVNLQAVQTRAIEFAWPPGNVIFKIQQGAKPAKRDQRALKKQAEQAKKLESQQKMAEFFAPMRTSVQDGALKPVRFPPPPGGRVTETYMAGLISANDRDSLLYLYKSSDWPLARWEADAWSAFLNWLTGPDS